MSKSTDIKEVLDWYILAGVTETCGEQVCLQATDTSLSSAFQKPVISKTPSTSSVLKNATDVCLKASSLEELKDALLKFNGCNLKNTAINTVFGDGFSQAKVMLIGEAPGADEDRCGKPFVGRCGKLLDKILNAVQLNRADCYITNVLPWRPPGNRTPTDEEIAVCLPFLKRQIELVNPSVLILLGGIALKTVVDCNDSISRSRGKWLTYSSNLGDIPTLATYHPSYLLRSSSQKAKVWTDFLRIKNKLAEME